MEVSLVCFYPRSSNHFKIISLIITKNDPSEQNFVCQKKDFTCSRDLSKLNLPVF